MATPIFTPALSINGRWDKTTVKAMQRFLKYYGYYPKSYLIDGIVGYWTARGMQLWLRAKGYYPASKYKIDGDDGPATWAAVMKLMVAYWPHITGWNLYDGWVPYHSPKVWDEISLLQRYLNNYRYPVIQA